MIPRLRPILFAGLLATVSLPAFGETKAVPQGVSTTLPQNAKLAIVGDSITEQKQYSKFIEVYLLASAGRQDIKVFQYGWSGERAGGFAARMENDLSTFQPTAMTLCYGMNDGSYVAYSPNIGNEYEKNMRAILTKAAQLGVKNIVAGSPGAVDTKYYANKSTGPDVYNDNLAHLRDIDAKLAAEFKTGFANVHDEMINAMTKAKAKLGVDYDVCGRDGVHPNSNGQLLMALAFLKSLGLDGNIGTITVDLKGSATATEGHKVLSSANGSAELESTRWPFCFEGDAKGGTRSILSFCDFNEKLNRYTLQVKNLSAPKAKVTWGKETKEFTKEQLASGINLAAEFTSTPFDGAFSKFSSAVGAKQSQETVMIKNLITHFRSFAGDVKEDKEFASALEVLKKKMTTKQQTLDTEARKLLVPVKHTLKVEAVQ
ncbi:lysophospholipase L1-like esterase [Roseimicrobium gellanilyticum]|uniref:Lysophospholipase L1-like esterase n=1 Tax=Roseimicrobium gellanilyticum TaxID=748857 RepID=A0A366H1V6_9BACT|nr:SGNH/GDSL hydrolase family protein [Roseimicrobium gellanilyticum]RBP35870.1 lysophospholipase L1-like esterase [Roseimicrobium gellanilyticum]